MFNELKRSSVNAVSGYKAQSFFNDKIIGGCVPFPPQLSIRPMIFNRREAFKRWPGLEKTIENLKSECGKIPYPFEMSGVVECRRKLAGMESDDMSYGQALVLNLPIEFELYIAELVVQKPSLTVRYSLDKRCLIASYEWTCYLGWERRSLMVSAYSLYKSGLTDCFTWHQDEWGVDSLLFVPVVLVSGNWVACGGFYYDGCDASVEQCTAHSCGNYKAHRHWSSDELEQARALALKVGSAYPWEGKPWLDAETDTYLSQIFIKINKGKSVE